MFPCGHCICQNCPENITNSTNNELKPSINDFIRIEPSQGLEDGERVYVYFHNENDINDNNDANDEEYYDFSNEANLEDIDYTGSNMVNDLGLYTYPPVHNIQENNTIQEVNNANNIESSVRHLPKLTINPG